MIPFLISLMLFIFAMTLVISQNDYEFANLIKTFYECRNNNKASDLQKQFKKYRVHYCFGDKEIRREYGSALIIPTFKESVIINDETYSVTKVIHNIDELDITVILK